jgi:transcriptional regulator with XRE-family HTH domain
VENITKCLANNIKKLRKENDLTQGELADLAGISLVFLQGIESEKKWISPSTVSAIASALQVEESKLFENCQQRGFSFAPKKFSRQKPKLEHVPDDVFYALLTVCRHPEWKWETFRWILEGYARGISLDSVAKHF